MPPQDEQSTDPGNSPSSLGGPLLAAGAFAAGAVATLVAKRLIDARRNAGSVSDEVAGGDEDSKDDLATVLRRAALDVAVLASGQAAERLQSRDEEAETEAEGAASSSR